VRANGGKLKFFTTTREEKEVEVTRLESLSMVVESLQSKYPGLVLMMVPVPLSSAPPADSFTALTNGLVGSSFSTPTIICDQGGINRATTGCVATCTFREFQVAASYDGLVTTVPGVDLDTLKMDKYTDDTSKDPMMKGEYNVTKKVMEALDGVENAKKECDKIIDLAARGGNLQLREDIATAKLKYELVDDAEQAVLKHKIINNLERYMYLILFTTYMRGEVEAAKDATNNAENKLTKDTIDIGKKSIPSEELVLATTFSDFMKTEKGLELEALVASNKADLKWDRDITPEAWAGLEAIAKDFRANLGNLIEEILRIAHTTFSDIPRGVARKRASYRFASTTLLKLLPMREKIEVEKLIKKKTLAVDLYDILGHVTWRRGR
jgi:hypothetical protein